jgi:uncharacterized protein (TIGR03435 family)
MKIGSGWIKLFCGLSAMALFLFFADARPLQAQSANANESAAAAPKSQAGGAGVLEFEAVSIRPSARKFYLQGSDFLSPTSEMAPPPGGLLTWNVQLSWLVNFAYGLHSSPVMRQAWQTLPKWAQDESYAVDARARENSSREDVRKMVRSMLERRFQFKAHLESREGDVFSLEVAKPGLGLKPHAEGEPCTLAATLTDETRYPHAYPPYKGFAPRCGVFNRQLSRYGERRLELLNVSMQQVVDAVAQMLPTPVIDHTGLPGRYDAVLEFGPPGVSQSPDPSDEFGLPLLPEALEKQLGLKLNKQKAQVDVFVLDHIGALSEN